MDLLPELTARRAFRSISAEELAEEEVTALLAAATLAPSCFNNQPWRLVAARGEALPRLREALPEGNKWATRAPLIVILATKASLDCRQDEGRDYAYFDTGLAAMALMLEATRRGLRAHPIAGYSPGKVRKAVELPPDFVPLALVVVGKPGDDELLAPWQKERERGPRERKPLGEVAYDGVWERPWPAKAPEAGA